MENTVRTVYAAAVQTALALNKVPVIPEHTTLNEKFNVQATTTLTDSEIPAGRYIAIGNRGHKSTIGADNFPLVEVVQHYPTDAALFNHLPFVLRLPSNDLLPVVREKYRIRRMEVHDGVTYVAYYLKVLDTTETVVQMTYNSVKDGVTTTSAFIPTLSDLNPTPRDISNVNVTVTSGDYVAATGKVTFSMSDDDVAEFLNVVNIIYGDERYAIISELAVCSGVDRPVSGEFATGTATYIESIATQVMAFIPCMYMLNYSDTKINVRLEIGNVEPLLKPIV